MSKKTTNTRKEFNTTDASLNLISAMEDAINHMTEELRKKPDGELTGSQRRSELQSYKEVAVSCKELIQERQRLIEYVKQLEDNGTVEDKRDFSSGFAEKFSTK